MYIKSPQLASLSSRPHHTNPTQFHFQYTHSLPHNFLYPHTSQHTQIPCFPFIFFSHPRNDYTPITNTCLSDSTTPITNYIFINRMYRARTMEIRKDRDVELMKYILFEHLHRVIVFH